MSVGPAAAFEDGWFKTGDVGAIDEEGFLHITDRIKDLIITSQGKNVAPQHIEAMFGSNPYVESVAVLGDRRAYVSALVVPAFPVLEQHARESGIPFATREELVKRPEVVALYERGIGDVCRRLAGYEQIKRFTLVPTQGHCSFCTRQLRSTEMVSVEMQGDLRARYTSRMTGVGGYRECRCTYHFRKRR